MQELQQHQPMWHTDFSPQPKSVIYPIQQKSPKYIFETEQSTRNYSLAFFMFFTRIDTDQEGDKIVQTTLTNIPIHYISSWSPSY